ncbi:hypothetical protein [Pinisolibacter aquiterrae]|uniref:hypothetical protein n=1 Tax=Pinisolibacter aquiterrae TaxID=2815579 RepID=UPI001C3D1924|nr:hypothetical protein [Pinisolibacter aquiterrae]MBV5264490.1 hypothetical protein [Pinisolibacter aquiterrae]MCC8234362.1 hypothetical protein [Pinisolibacter aquiterrae]
MVDVLWIGIREEVEAGDFSRLISKLRDEDGYVPQEARILIADIIEGKIVRPANRPRSVNKEYEEQKIADYVRFLQYEYDMKQMAAISKAMEEFKISERSVRTFLARRSESALLTHLKRTRERERLMFKAMAAKDE